MSYETLDFDEFARRYCERQENDPETLAATLREKNAIFSPTGWLLVECQDLSSSRLGSYVILPYGGGATIQEIPAKPFSPRGLASDMSVVVAVLPVEKIPQEATK